MHHQKSRMRFQEQRRGLVFSASVPEQQQTSRLLENGGGGLGDTVPFGVNLSLIKHLQIKEKLDAYEAEENATLGYLRVTELIEGGKKISSARRGSQERFLQGERKGLGVEGILNNSVEGVSSGISFQLNQRGDRPSIT